MKKIKTNEKKGNDTKEYFSLESKDNCKFDVNLINEEIDTETLPILVEMEKKIPDHEYTLERHDKSVSKLKSESEIHNIKKKLFKVIPLGGLEQIGMNMTVFEYKDSIIVVDCGIAFPDEATHPGIDAIIPDITYLIENKEKVKGFVITHGHEDHIGAIPYIIKRLNVPIYGTPLTIELVKYKLTDIHLNVECNTVQFGDTIQLGDISVEFIRTNHSIVDAAALAIKTDIGTIIHTGDFKVDYTPVYNDRIDIARLAQLGDEGVLAMLCDSTNAERPGFTPSERTIAPIIDSLFDKYSKKRIIISTFASNVDRVQQIIDVANKHNRKVLLEGRSMVAIISIASELGKITLPENVLITEDDIGNYSREQLCIIATGSQGEEMAALSRMANGTHKLKITPDDVIIFSSHPIPGNEKSISNITNAIRIQGADICYNDTHVSGHACQEELKLMYSLVRPKFAIPIHGEYKHRVVGGNIAEMMGIPKDNIFLLDSGSVIAFTKSGNAKRTTEVKAGCNYIDSYSGEMLEEIVLYDRKKVSKSGFINVIVPIEKTTNTYLGNVEIVSRGLMKVDTSQEFFDDLKNVAEDCIETMMTKKGILKNFNKAQLQGVLKDYVLYKINKYPMILVTLIKIDLS